MPPSSVHFNGSVNLPDAETVMQEISSRIPTGVRRMTDGETGERGYWILFQIQKFLAMPEFESVTVGQAYETSADAPQMPQLRLAEGASADTISWPNLGYARFGAKAMMDNAPRFDHPDQVSAVSTSGVRGLPARRSRPVVAQVRVHEAHKKQPGLVRPTPEVP